MAVTLDEPAVAEGTVHVSFPILKWERDGDGDLVVRGVATDGTVDHDDQIVDPQWSAKALDAWIGSGGNVRMAHNAQRPVGKGLKVEVNKDGTDKHWVTSVIVDRDAQRLVEKGVLTAYSVGISRPVIKHDPSGRARGGIIVGGELAELSIVDRPSNKSSYLELAKAAADGTCEFTGKMFGTDDEAIRKALDEPDVTKAIAPAETRPVDISSFQMPEDLSITFTPADMARLVKSKFVEQHYAELAAQAATTEKRNFDRGVGGGVDRDKLPDSDFAGPHRSFPIVTQSDVSDALRLVGHADDPAAVRARIHSIARRKGFSVPDDNDSTKGTEEVADPVAEKADAPAETDAAVPDVTKEPDGKDAPVKKAKGKKKKLPPWLNKPKDGDGDNDDAKGGDSDDDASKACKSAADHVWTGVVGTPDIICSKCHTTPAQAAGVAGTHDMAPAPVGDLMESQGPASTKGATPASASGAVGESMKPVPAHREPDGDAAEEFEADAGMSDGDSEKTATPDLAPNPEVAALLRFKMAGADEDLGRLHDLTCPAYHPEQVAKYHPYAELGNLIDSRAWQRKTLAAASGPLEASLKAQEVWQAALLLKTADTSDLNQWRLELHKAFRDANPGPGSFPTPGHVSPQRYNRPVLTDGRAANSTSYGPPNSSPQVATTAPNAQSFDRPPLSSGHQSPSPSHMKGDGQYPAERGVPTQLSYAQTQREHQRQALVRMHEHLSRQFPEVCPISLDPTPVQPERHPVPVPAGIGKGDDRPLAPETIAKSALAVAEAAADQARWATGHVAAFKATPEDGTDMFADADIYKAFKKMRKKLGKRVLSGKMTVDEARAKLGRQFTQKGADEPAETVQKAATAPAALSPEVIKAAVREALHVETVPLETAEIKSFDPSPAIEAAVTKAMTPLLERIDAQDKALAENQRVLDAIADQPDPSTAAFHGLAFQPTAIKSRRPAGVPDQAEYAARAREMVRRNLEHTYQTHSNPVVREKAAEALATFGVEAAPMT